MLSYVPRLGKNFIRNSMYSSQYFRQATPLHTGAKTTVEKSNSLEENKQHQSVLRYLNGKLSVPLVTNTLISSHLTALRNSIKIGSLSRAIQNIMPSDQTKENTTLSTFYDYETLAIAGFKKTDPIFPQEGSHAIQLMRAFSAGYLENELERIIQTIMLKQNNIHSIMPRRGIKNLFVLDTHTNINFQAPVFLEWAMNEQVTRSRYIEAPYPKDMVPWLITTENNLNNPTLQEIFRMANESQERSHSMPVKGVLLVVENTEPNEKPLAPPLKNNLEKFTTFNASKIDPQGIITAASKARHWTQKNNQLTIIRIHEKAPNNKGSEKIKDPLLHQFELLRLNGLESLKSLEEIYLESHEKVQIQRDKILS